MNQEETIGTVLKYVRLNRKIRLLLVAFYFLTISDWEAVLIGK